MFTDASHNEALQRATYAVWFKWDGQTFRHAGPIRGPITQIGDGELAAIANGIYLALKHVPYLMGGKIIIQTDSMEAIAALLNRRHRRPTAHRIVDHILNLQLANNLTLDYRHVKGHKGNLTPRNAVNTWCDRQCTIEMSKLRAAPDLLERHTPTLTPTLTPSLPLP
jgi:hypothetical protein